MEVCDVAVIGAGPAGVAAALKTVEAGYRTVVVERHPQPSKPCGGILTRVCVNLLSGELGLCLPENVLSTPSSLGLFYVSPSGFGGRVKNYKLVNVDRRSFDEWLRCEAEERGVKMLYGANLAGFERCGQELLVRIKRRGRMEELAARFLIGADGALSKTRRLIYPNVRFKLASVVQEHWLGEGELEDCFYTLLLKASLTPLYGYLIPKGSTFIVGAGGSTFRNAEASLANVKEALMELGFKPRVLLRKERWFIPQGTVLCGEGNVALVGDAGGFCNPFSGEGVRFALETGAIAGRAISEEKSLESYVRDVEELALLIRTISGFMSGLDDEEREKFVRRELRRAF